MRQPAPLSENPTILENWRKHPKRKLSQAAVAKELGVTQAYISALEKRSRKPSDDVLKRIGAMTKVSVAKLKADLAGE